jgi:hypothetical protein
MKKLILGMLAGCFVLAASVTKANAQVSVNVNVGLWNPPAEYASVAFTNKTLSNPLISCHLQ